MELVPTEPEGQEQQKFLRSLEAKNKTSKCQLSWSLSLSGLLGSTHLSYQKYFV